VSAETASRARGRIAEIFGLDLRSLALFRVAIALTALIDVATRAADLGAHYSDAGIEPRRDVLDEFAFLHDQAISLHLMAGSAAFEALLFAAAGLAAIALLFGYRTRIAAVVLWALTTSVQLRNLYVGGGYDALLRMLLLWGCFLPLGARASIDATREGPADASRPHVSVASVALLIQVALVFFVAGYGKWMEPAWRNGTAVADIFADDMRVTALGAHLRGHPGLLASLTFAIPWLEMVAPLLFFSPFLFGILRTAAVAGLAAMVIGFGFGLHVGLFPAAALAGLSAVLPGRIWDGRARRSPIVAAHSPMTVLSRLARRRWRLVADSICAVLLAFVCAWNLAPIVAPSAALPTSLEWVGKTLFLQQAWTLFAKPATRTGWLVMPGKLRDGQAIDLLAAGGRVPDLETASRPIEWTAPSLPLDQYANDRWRNFFDRAVRGTDTSRRLNLYGRFLCRGWNAEQTGGKQLVAFEIWWVAAEVVPGAGVGPYEKRLIWSHACFS
jgi:hypothetical protein